MKNPECTTTQIIEKTKIPPASVYRIVNVLKRGKIIYKSGMDKNHLGPNDVKYSTKYDMIRFDITKNGITVNVK